MRRPPTRRTTTSWPPFASLAPATGHYGSRCSIASSPSAAARADEFALLLVDLDSVERLRLAGADEAAEAFARISRAVREHVRRADVVAHEDDGRVWVIAGDTGRTGAMALALRIADAVEAAASLHGAALTASVGIAIYPDDGREAAALTAQAEEGMYAARAAGTRVGGGPEPEGAPQGGLRSGPRAVS